MAEDKDQQSDAKQPPPRAFLSHASEDKDRFARALAEGLAERGVDVWFDEWELLPGDSLVSKIFDEGLKNAEAMVIVISEHSIKKPWVLEELDAGMVKKIQERCKLIPIVIDDCEVPEPLKHIYWERVADVDNYEKELDRIVRAIFGERTKRELGAPPAYAAAAALAGLDSADTRVLQVACERALEIDQKLIASEDVLKVVDSEGISEESLLESLVVLEEHGYLRVERTLASGIDGMSCFVLATAGLHEYGEAFLPDYENTLEAVAARLVNEPESGATDRSIAGALGKPRLLIEHVLDLFEANGLIRLSKASGSVSLVHHVSPQLKRKLRGQANRSEALMGSGSRGGHPYSTASRNVISTRPLCRSKTMRWRSKKPVWHSIPRGVAAGSSSG